MANDWFATNLAGIIDSVIAAIVCVVFAFAARKAGHFVSNWFRVPMLIKASGAVVISFIGVALVPGQSYWAVHVAACTVGAAVLILFLRAVFEGYGKIGFAAAFRSTKDGIGFEKSLKMADGSLDFLGVGGDKLTKTKAFAEAMVRCASNGRVVRMLLSPPDHPLLEILAKRNNVDTTSYSKNVKESLRRIARVKADRELNIQVRFYPLEEEKDWQIFRLMFLNNKVCLWSWTVWGLHLGEENPQVILVNTDKISQTSAFNAFHDYFKRLWEDPRCKSVDWDAYQ